jgi:uncharacterized membrane protein YukC
LKYKPDEKRATFHKFQNYLRVLDAKAAKVRTDDIMDELYPGSENSYPNHYGRGKVKNDFNAAKKLRDSDYRYLPFKENLEVIE